MASELQREQAQGGEEDGERRDVSNAQLDFRWLARHRQEHLGRWVALRDGVLLDTDEDGDALRERVHARHSASVLITKIRG